MKTLSIKRNFTTNKWYVIAALAMIIVVIALLWIFIGKKMDFNRFTEVDKRKDETVSRMVAELGRPIAVEEKNICFNAERGPYGSGKTWCQTATAAYYAKEADKERIYEVYNNAAKSTGLDTVKPGIRCTVIVYDGHLPAITSYHFEGNDQAKQIVMVRCADRAKAKHYPYVE